MPAKITRALKNLSGSGKTAQYQREKDIPLAELAAAAKEEWLNAQTMCREAVEPELIDYHSYMVKACEAYYMYILRRIKEETPHAAAATDKIPAPSPTAKTI